MFACLLDQNFTRVQTGGNYPPFYNAVRTTAMAAMSSMIVTFHHFCFLLFKLSNRSKPGFFMQATETVYINKK